MRFGQTQTQWVKRFLATFFGFCLIVCGTLVILWGVMALTIVPDASSILMAIATGFGLIYLGRLSKRIGANK